MGQQVHGAAMVLGTAWYMGQQVHGVAMVLGTSMILGAAMAHGGAMVHGAAMGAATSKCCTVQHSAHRNGNA